MGRKRTMFRYADKVDKVLMLLGTMGCIGDGLMSPLTMLVLSGIINEYGGSDLSSSNQVVDKYSLRLLFVAIGVGVSAFFEGICWTRTAERQTSRMRTEYLKSILGQEVGFFDNQSANSSTSHVISTMSSDAHSIQDAMAEKIPNCLAHFTSFIFSIVVSFILSWRLALASLPFSLGFIIPGLGFGKIMMKLGIKMKNAYGVAGLLAEQAISSIRTVYSYVGEKQTLERFSLALQESKEIGIKLGFTKGLLIGSMGMVYGAWAFQAWVGSVLVSERGESGGKVFISGVSVVLGGISCISAFPNLSFITEAKASSARIFDMIDRSPATTSDKTKKLKKTRPKNNIRGEIEFKNVYFNYPSRPDTPILQNFNLKAKAGKTVGLVGGSGCGKSTVVCLLERFYDPVKGDIFLDGFKIKKVEVKWLRSHMGLVNQEPVLFATSIKENILFGKEGATMELVVEAAKAANAHDFIIKLPNKYDTQVGQFGVQLSGGQKQRIAIARALLKDPKILLLDEATSALDAQSEQVVQDALDQASHGRTTIIIAHRLTTIRKADKIAVIQSGRVVEFGSHDELIQPQNGHVGAYAKMVQLQQSTSEKNKYRKTANAETPNARIRVKSNWQNSPVFSPFTPYSIQVHSYYDSDDSYLEKEKPSSHNPPSLRRLLRMNAPEWKRSLLGCLGACLFGAIQPINAYCLGSIVSVYFLNDLSKIKSQAKFYTVVFLTLAVLSFVANLLQHYNFAIMGECLVKRVREKMLQKLLSFEVGWFDQDENTSGAVCARLQTEANMVRSLVGDRISLLVQVFVSASFAFILGLVVTWRVSAVMIATQPLVILCFYSKSVLMKVMSEKARKAQNEGCQLASEAVVNHRTITAFSSQDKILELFELTLQGPKRESIKQSWFSGFGLLTSQFLTTASVTLTFWYGGRLMNQRLVTSKHLFQAFFILMSTGKNIADAGSMTSDLAKGGNAVRSVFEILDRKSEIEPEKPERPGKPGKSNPENPDIRGRIELRNVYFSYPSRPEQVIFQGLNLKIEAGKRVALVGESGSGKSTIIGLVERFYDPIKGSVLIDDEDIKSYNLRWLRSHIALVSQEPTLFAGTIRENIIYGNEGATEGEIRKAAKLANAHEFISSMKDGYGTYCGERGVQLSGGQKQRIALARAILKNPKILLLDEATSALDSVSENLVQESLEKLMINRTCIVVAHRLSTIQKSDSIAVIKNGKVVEKGSHSDLLAVGSEGFYYNLIKLQSGHSM